MATTAKLVALTRNAPCLAHDKKVLDFEGFPLPRHCFNSELASAGLGLDVRRNLVGSQ